MVRKEPSGLTILRTIHWARSWYPTTAKGTACFSCRGGNGSQARCFHPREMVRREARATRHRTFVQEAAFAKMASRNEISFLVGDYSAAVRFQPPACAADISGKLQEAGVCFTLRPKKRRR